MTETMLKLTDRKLIEIGCALNNGAFGRDPARMNKRAKIAYILTLGTEERVAAEVARVSSGDIIAPKPSIIQAATDVLAAAEAAAEAVIASPHEPSDDPLAPPAHDDNDEGYGFRFEEGPSDLISDTPKPFPKAALPQTAGILTEIPSSLADLMLRDLVSRGGVTEERVRAIVREELRAAFARVAQP